MRALAVGLGLLGVALAGCSSPTVDTMPTSTSHVAQPETVAIDFFDAKAQTGACTGTLVSANVVLTTAHCAMQATQAFVRAPDASGQTASVTTVRFYDWTQNATDNHALQHDLALLVLSKKIKIASYPTIWDHAADGVSAQQARRTSLLALSSKTARSAALEIGKGRPTGNPLTLTVPKASADAGGALFGQDANGKRAIVGVMIGRGADSKTGYAARVADSGVRTWIAGVIADPTKAGTAPNALAGAHFFGDDDGGDPGGSDGFDQSGFDQGGFDQGGLDMGGADPAGGVDQDQPNPDTSGPDPVQDLPDPSKDPGGNADNTTTGFPTSDTQFPTTAGSDPPAPAATATPGGSEPIQTFGMPLSDTQFQVSTRANDDAMIQQQMNADNEQTQQERSQIQSDLQTSEFKTVQDAQPTGGIGHQ